MALGAVSGLLTYLAFPPVDAAWLGFVCLVPLAISVRLDERRAWVSAATFGFVFFGALLSWIRLFGLPAYVALVLLQTSMVALGLAATVPLRRALPGRMELLAFPAAFVLAEYARSHVPLGGFGWGGWATPSTPSLGCCEQPPSPVSGESRRL